MMNIQRNAKKNHLSPSVVNSFATDVQKPDVEVHTAAAASQIGRMPSLDN
jgi:hypothetical protein